MSKKPNKVNAEKEQARRKSITLLFAFVAMLIVFSVVLLVIVYLYIMISTGAMITDGILNNNLFFFSTIAVVIVLAPTISIVLTKLFFNPITKVIKAIDKLAEGDYKEHIETKGNEMPLFKDMNNSVNKLAEELQNTEVLHTDFINSFSHEFKTPIVSISGFAKELKDNPQLTEEQKKEYLNIIYSESMRLSDMATNVLNLSKVEHETILKNVVKYNISEQIRTCFLILEDKWSPKNIEPDFNFPEVIIQANEELMYQVWINLLGNAVKFTPENGTIRVRIDEGDELITFSIENSGSHFNETNKDLLFKKFYQEDSSHTHQGNGVGLAIVKRIVDLHHGSVEALNTTLGVEFIVRLPK